MKVNPLQGMMLLFHQANSVRCHQCGLELKGRSIPALFNRGCPRCGCQTFDYNMPDEDLVRRLNQALGRS